MMVSVRNGWGSNGKNSISLFTNLVDSRPLMTNSIHETNGSYASSYWCDCRPGIHHCQLQFWLIWLCADIHSWNVLEICNALCSSVHDNFCLFKYTIIIIIGIIVAINKRVKVCLVSMACASFKRCSNIIGLGLIGKELLKFTIGCWARGTTWMYCTFYSVDSVPTVE